MHEDEQRAEFDLLMKSQYWSAEQVQGLQYERLEKLLHHARAHVPFYTSRLDALFDADGSVDWHRWSALPTLKRDELHQHRRAMLARSVPDGHQSIGDIATSGSTGRPVTTSHSYLTLELTKAAVYRANVNDKVDFGTPLGAWAGERADIAPWPEGRRGGPWGPPWDARAEEGETFTVSHLASPDKCLEFFGRHSVRYALMGGTDARLLAMEARRLGISLSLDGVFTRGTDITRFGTELVAEVFGAKAFPLYSSKEAHRIAHRCPDCGKWHVNDEQVLVEILDDQNRPVAPGESGRVVVTPLLGFAQPLIRYEQGDFATAASGPTCSRGLTAIEEVLGRVRHMFVMPDGSRIVPTLTVGAVAALNAAMFQVAQVSRDRVELRLVPLKATGPAQVEQALQELSIQLDQSITVCTKVVDSLEVKPGQKHIEFLNELSGQL